MAEQMLDTTNLGKSEVYDALEAQLEALLEGEDDLISRMSSVVCLLHHGLGNLWTGFYRVVRPGLLKVGPYQGTLGCLEIPFENGVCGAAARTGKTQLVADVTAFPGHITCDARSRSEIVVPVFNKEGELIAVLDLDSEALGAYDQEDQRRLEGLIQRFFA